MVRQTNVSRRGGRDDGVAGRRRASTASPSVRGVCGTQYRGFPPTVRPREESDDATSPPAGARTPGVAPFRRSAATIQSHSVRELPLVLASRRLRARGVLEITSRARSGCVRQGQRRGSGVHRFTKIESYERADVLRRFIFDN